MSSKHTSLRFIHLPTAEISHHPAAHVLGAIHFSSGNADEANEAFPNLHLNASILHGNAASELLLLSDVPAAISKLGNISYRANDDFLFGVIHLPENNDASGLHNSTRQAYNEIFALMQELGFRYIYRFWNYMADINGMSDGLERYRQFNAGRKEAFEQHESLINEHYPAACALGLADGPLSIAFLLGRHLTPVAIENPRQVSAYEYPEQYGPRTPSFSRATLLKPDDASTEPTQSAALFISGTASIVGHETRHADDVVAQTHETLANLAAVIEQANQQLSQPLFKLPAMFLRVYVRHVHDLAAIQQVIQDYLNAPVYAIYIQADICRQDLLLEIEATAQVKLDLIEPSSPKAFAK
jgi:enamine deaminase RidA (YjgF/YER057c/UK114 family)